MIHYITAKQTLSSKKKKVHKCISNFFNITFLSSGKFHYVKWKLLFPSVKCFSPLISGEIINHSTTTCNTVGMFTRVCFYVCTRVCVTKRQILPVFAFGSILGAYFLLCTVVCLLSATSLQVTHAHNEQWNHTSTGCQATSKTLTDSAEMESDSNLARKTQAAGEHHFD